MLKDALKLLEDGMEADDGETYSFSSTQFDIVDDDLVEKIKAFQDNIPEEELYEDPEDSSYGREDNPHITVKYGIHSNKPDETFALLDNEEPVHVTLGKLDMFEADDYDVLIIPIESEGLHKINGIISDGVEVTDTHPEYNPHLTIAYLKKGTIDKYLGDDTFDGIEMDFDTLTFSPADGEVHKLTLGDESFADQMTTEGATMSKVDKALGVLLGEKTSRLKEGTEWDAEKFLNAVLTRDNDAIVNAAMGWYKANKDDHTVAYSADALRASVEDNDAEGIYENMDDLIERAMKILMPDDYKKYVKSGLPRDPVPVIEKFLKANHKQHSMRADRFDEALNCLKEGWRPEDKRTGLYYDEEEDYYYVYEYGDILYSFDPEEFDLIRNGEIIKIPKEEFDPEKEYDYD